MRPVPWTLLALLALASTAQAAESAGGDPLCIIFIEPEEDFSVIRIRADLILDDAERAGIASEADADADGRLTQAEVDAYVARKEARIERAADMASRIMYLDGAPPDELIVRVRLTNWTGPAETARNGTVTEAREYRFGTIPYDYEHAIAGGLGAHPYRIPKPVVEVVVVNAPEGWYVASVGQSPPSEGNVTTTTWHPEQGNLYVGMDRSVTLEGFDLESAYAMVFRDATPETSRFPQPGFEAAAAVGAALVTALLLAARRRA